MIIKAPPKRTFKGVKKYVSLYNVYDGDTIEIITKLDMFEKNKCYMLRLKGFDSLELKPKKTLENRKVFIEYAEKIRDILINLLTPILYVEFEGEDKYGRLLGTVYNTKVYNFCIYRYKSPYLNINEWILNNKLALPYNGATKTEYTYDWILQNKNNINRIYLTYVNKTN